MIVQDSDITKSSNFSLEVNFEGNQLLLTPCTIKDLLATDTFKKYFNLTDDIKFNSFSILCLYAVESEISAH